mgnify:CR=1 FL=1
MEAVLAFYDKVAEELDFLANSNEKVMELLNEKEKEQKKVSVPE